jgi:hypothetical protein
MSGTGCEYRLRFNPDCAAVLGMVRRLAVVMPTTTKPLLPAENMFGGKKEALVMLVVVRGAPPDDKDPPGPAENSMSYDAPVVGAPGVHDRVLALDKYQVAPVAGGIAVGPRIVGALVNCVALTL